jgi:hypothetical protein
LIIASHGILGKFILITIILFYASRDLVYGIFVCILAIFYYQFNFETMLNYSPLNYSPINSEHDIISCSNQSFQEKHCQAGELKFKGMVVKPEMSEHIFPEINFEHGRCNVCDSACMYKIVNPPEQELSYRQIF